MSVAHRTEHRGIGIGLQISLHLQLQFNASSVGQESAMHRLLHRSLLGSWGCIGLLGLVRYFVHVASPLDFAFCFRST